MTDAYIFIGSNIDREKKYLEAVRCLRELGTLAAASPVYDTAPLGAHPDAPRFYNGAVLLKTNLSPHALRNALREIERALGRVRSADKDAPRLIDLDLVLYGEVTLDDGELRIPDPLLFERGIMAHALAHISPDYVIPPDGPTLGELACQLRVKTGDMIEVPELSEQVRRLVEPSSEAQLAPTSSLALPALGFADDEWGSPMPNGDGLADSPGSLQTHLDKEAAHRAIEDAVRTILLSVGEDPTRQGLLKTPERVARAYDELLAGYAVDPVALVNDAFFDSEYHDMVVVKDIEFYSLCEHHMLPFFGQVHVAYIPDGKVLGLSKIPRIVDMYARRLQLQERMTHQIADFIQDLLHPRGVAVIVSGQHMCSMMRGVNKPDSKMVTQILYGEFQQPGVREQLTERLRA